MPGESLARLNDKSVTSRQKEFGWPIRHARTLVVRVDISGKKQTDLCLVSGLTQALKANMLMFHENHF
jgi:hypothetical protein